ncbi:hypothetical protein BH10ACI2_BH10ACI2_04370 [soil metagenome]
MPNEKYNSHIAKPQRHTTSRGGSFITPFDIVRSERGRDLVDRHADMANKSGERNIDNPRTELEKIK